MRLAAIDCGTNTLLMLVADAGPDGVRAVEEHHEIVRLGEGLAQSGELKPEAMGRALGVLERFVERIRALRCDAVLAVGTESIRRAKNGHVFAAEATGRLGAVGGRLETIDGEREARLCWRAVKASFPGLAGPRTVIDIGGGSTELLVGEDQVDEVVSLKIGSVVLTERHVAHDPPTAAEQAALTATVEAALDGAAVQPRGTLVGIAGTVTTLAAMAQRLTVYDGDKVHGARLSRDDLDQMVAMLARLPVEDRKRTPGLEPKRADVIYAGAVILSCIVRRAGASEVVVSDRGIRWGLVYEAAGLG